MEITAAPHTVTGTGLSAITVLTEDHDKVNKLFQQFETFKKDSAKTHSDTDKEKIVRQICQELTLHARAEEEIFYPAVRAAIAEQELMDEAETEHHRAKELIAQLEAMSPADDYYDAKVALLKESISHHVKEEQDQIFPRAKKVNLNLEALGEQILSYKEMLRRDTGSTKS
jgi:hemerythrin superfamily protein